jgi:5-methylcytosine-specific restriction endonuclease McrA
MNLLKISDLDLHVGTKNSVMEEKSSTIKVLKFLEEVHRRKLFIEYGYSTLMNYMIFELGYSEGESWTRIQAMKLIVEAPEVEKEIENGNMSLSNAAAVKEAFRQNEKLDKKEIIEMALHNPKLPTRKLKELINPQVQEKKIILNERILKKIKKLNGDMSEIELIESLIDEKLKTIELSKSKNTTSKPSTNSRYIPKSVERAVFKRAEHQCEHIGKDGKRCQERRNLQKDHIKPFALGGKNSKDNIRILCSGHNLRRAVKTYGSRQTRTS